LGSRAGWLRRLRTLAPASELIRGFSAETEIEQRIVEDPVILRGLAWGEPRHGHPEGSVGRHVADLLERIDVWGEQDSRRSELRLIALLHDALKYKVVEWLPHTGLNHHAVRARKVAERYLVDERLLATIELHDKPYGLWRRMHRTGELDRRSFEAMLARIPDQALFLRFVELDGSTEGKKSEPIEWFRAELERRGSAR
jgi:hypothetical protein